jgi:adenine-specific DNA-methyltransferase
VVMAQEAGPAQPSSASEAVLQVLASVPAWWANQASAAGLDAAWQSLDRAQPPPPVNWGSATPSIGANATPAELGDAYIRALDPEIRLAEGRHYTPALLAEHLWRELVLAGLPEEPRRIVDPACGAGALLLPGLRAFVAQARNPDDALVQSPRLFFGTDLDALAVWLGNVLLAAQLLPLWSRIPASRRRPLPSLLHVGDGLASSDDAPGIIVMNPPFGRVRLSPQERSRWERSLYGHANRYGIFLHAAVERAAVGGLIAAVLPASFLGGAYYQRLREFIASTAPMVRLVFVDERSQVFAGDVLQETCLCVFQKGSPHRQVTCSRVNVNGQADAGDLGQVTLAGQSGHPWLLPRRSADIGLIARAATLPHRLADYGWRASTGPLVWNRHKHQISAEASNGATRIMWAADIGVDGTVRQDRARDHQRWVTLTPSQSFMRLQRPAVLVQRTTAPEQPRRLVAAELNDHDLSTWGGAVVVENHVNVLHRPAESLQGLSPALLTALLNTGTFDRLYRCLSGTVAVSAYELEALPLPPPDVLTAWETVSTEELEAIVASFYDA